MEHEGQNYVPEDGSIGWLIDIAKKYQDKPLVLTVYNRRYGEPREVTIVPALGWGGEGLLGNFAYA